MYHHQGSNNSLSSREPFPSERHLLLGGGNIPGDSGLVLSTDAKPRLKWTPELHEHFIEAVNQLGGADKATPKTVMRLMGIPGLTLYHLKSHLQKYRLSKNMQVEANIGSSNNVIGCMTAVDRTYEVTGSRTSSTNILPQANKTMQISEALQMQIEVQRRLHEQLEVQRHLQLRIEAQGKYLQTVLEKAQETLGKQSLGSAGSEATKVQLSELVFRVSNECLSNAFQGLEGFPSLCPQQSHTAGLVGSSLDSCLTACEGSQKDQERDNTNIRLGAYHRTLPLYTQNVEHDIKIEQSKFTWSENLDKDTMFSSSMVKDSEQTVLQIRKDSSILSMGIKAQNEKEASNTSSETQCRERDKDAHLEHPNSKRLATQQERAQHSNGFELQYLTADLDLNSHNDDDCPPNCKQFDLNGFSWS